MKKETMEELNIPHLQTDDNLITFYCVRRMPNGRLAVARTAVEAEAFDGNRNWPKPVLNEIIIGDLRAASPDGFR